MGAGDAICQSYIEKELKPYDWLRTAKFAGVGLFVVVKQNISSILITSH